MNIQRKKNGNLLMSASEFDKREIQIILDESSSVLSAESIFILEILGNNPMGDGISYEQVQPEEIGALTSAPLISDGQNIYGFMNYQIKNFLDELLAGNEIEWQKG